jgi:transcriptional regulator with XRE-family HTH domain
MPYLKKRKAKFASIADGAWRELPVRLEAARRARALSQADLSRKSNVARSLLSRLESTERPSLAAETLLRLSDALGVRPHWLWKGTGPMNMAEDDPELREFAATLDGVAAKYSASALAVAKTFATAGERHTPSGWIARLDEIESILAPILPK